MPRHAVAAALLDRSSRPPAVGSLPLQFDDSRQHLVLRCLMTESARFCVRQRHPLLQAIIWAYAGTEQHDGRTMIMVSLVATVGEPQTRLRSSVASSGTTLFVAAFIRTTARIDWMPPGGARGFVALWSTRSATAILA